MDLTLPAFEYVVPRSVELMCDSHNQSALTLSDMSCLVKRKRGTGVSEYTYPEGLSYTAEDELEKHNTY